MVHDVVLAVVFLAIIIAPAFIASSFGREEEDTL
jgi:hypothetical protein